MEPLDALNQRNDRKFNAFFITLQSRGQQGPNHYSKQCDSKVFIISKGQWEPLLPLTAAFAIEEMIRGETPFLHSCRDLPGHVSGVGYPENPVHPLKYSYGSDHSFFSHNCKALLDRSHDLWKAGFSILLRRYASFSEDQFHG